MYIDPIPLYKKSQFIKDYREQKADVLKYFDYEPFGDLSKRLQDLQARDFDRENLANVLHTLNINWNAPQSTLDNIERLRDPNSVVVIGGQQAGLLTGPFYTLNKVISLLQFARQQEAKWNIPVIPVFWIAGEDHDFDEINHVYLLDKESFKKHKLRHVSVNKRPISQLMLDHDQAHQWLDEVFQHLDETEYTKYLYQMTKECLDSSQSYVDFFAHLLFALFKEQGLVLIDSGHEKVRQLESDHFVNMVEKQPLIASHVYATYQQLKQAGYAITLDVDIHDAHLFYHHQGERILLERDEDKNWVGKNQEVSLTTEELLHIAKHNPEQLSNNVVTRPLMQELLFPTLAFIGGDGEISYWSVLKGAFHALNIQMPPVVPRLSFTYVDRSLKKKLDKRCISCTEAINSGVNHLKINWIASQYEPPVTKMVEQLKESLNELHEPLRKIAFDIRADLGALAEKNLSYLFKEIDYLHDKIHQGIEDKYAHDLKEFDLIHQLLCPFGLLQERIWNPFVWMNEHGPYFITDLLQEECSFTEDHYLVYI